jgi:hypothetical protein
MDKIKQQWLALDPRVRAALQVIGVMLALMLAAEVEEMVLGPM